MDAEVLEREVLRQRNIFGALPILADLLRADVQLFELTSPDWVVIAAHAQPHSAPSVHPVNSKSSELAVASDFHLSQALRRGQHIDNVELILQGGAVRVFREIVPLFDRYGVVTGAVAIETAAAERERHKEYQSAHYLRALDLLKVHALRIGLPGADSLTPFTSRDGLVLLGPDRKVLFLNSIAEGMYAKVGVPGRPLGWSVERLESGDEQIVRQALQGGACVERMEAARDCTWLRKAIPLRTERPASLGKRNWKPPDAGGAAMQYVLLLIRDVTEERRLALEADQLANAQREIHHRVRNNLQTIISYARVDARSAKLPETRKAIAVLANRIFAVAKVHEYLSTDGTDVVDLREVSRQIADELRENLLPPSARVRIEVEGDPLTLPSKQATSCALVITELIQNAVEHAFPDGTGLVRVLFEDSPDVIRMSVVDDGAGLPPDFEQRHAQNLGLKIARKTMEDMRGEFQLTNRASPEHGVIAQLTLSRLVPGGR